MPFTFSHPAIILPLAKINSRYISLTALVAGSMAPDFEYFINFKMKQIHGHTIPGMFYYDLPLAIMLCFVFHYLVRDSFINHSPFQINESLRTYKRFDWMQRFKKSWIVIIYSAMIGIASHLFWDNFTHANRYFVQLIPFLQQEHEFGGYLIHTHAFAQLISSFVGLFILILYTFEFPKGKIKQNRTLIYWMLVTLTIITVLLIKHSTDMNVLIASSIAGGLLGLIIAPIIMRVLIDKKWKTS